MGKKQTVMIKVAYLVEVDMQEEGCSEGTLDKIMSKVGVDEVLDLGDEKVEMEWIKTSSHSLNPESDNCGRCSICGAWVTDREKEECICELSDGAVADGELKCDMCLPKDHRWAF